MDLLANTVKQEKLIGDKRIGKEVKLSLSVHGRVLYLEYLDKWNNFIS